MRKSLACALAACFTMSTFTATALADTTKSYTTNDHDTFWTIANKFNVTVSALEAANPSISPLNVYGGLTIDIPTSNTTVQNSAKMSASSTIDVNGVGEIFSKELSCVATAYTSNPAENPWGAVDYLGNPLKIGTVAVDPSVIPLGSTLYITGYKFNGLPTGGMICHATDEGGSIKGDRVDLYVPDGQASASHFGMQNVKVYILKK